ncbi:flagellar biosynthesis regulator FlaF [Rhodospirillaceae bacterium SYSU D60014]|uniref:flagellar biosynthesis regulator FlaF n=1 Tax=Virgifigura deserti TaxID=2268457 RepID=UPI0013C486E1
MEAIRAYEQTKRTFIDPRVAERTVFERVTAQLRHAAQLASRTSEFHEAVHANRRLWAAVIADVADPGNTLSTEMKEGLISLGLWVQRESTTAAMGRTELSALIDVNEAVINGLAPKS